MSRLLIWSAEAVLAALWLSCLGGCPTNGLIADKDSNEQAAGAAADQYARDRERMVRDQLAGRDIRDRRVLDAMGRVPRHLFVPPSAVSAAYDDNALPLMLGQTVSQPYIVAFMTQALELKGTEKVLEIGTGSGYQAAILAETAREVFSIEIIPELTLYAKSLLDRLGYTNIRFRTGDGFEGWAEHAPFDAIIVTAAPAQIPGPLIDQLAPGGRMIIPVGRLEQELQVLRKTASGVSVKSSIPVRFVPMTGRAQEKPPQ